MKKCARRLLMLAGLLGFLLLALQFTPLPSRVYYWLSYGGPALAEEPDVIVIMGGGGIPSESGLIRTYYGAVAAAKYPNALVAVAMPDSNDASTIRMVDELVLRGVKRERVIQEDKGRNTREQAVNLHRMLMGDGQNPFVLAVTSNEHIRRTVLSLRRAGLERVAGLAADPVAGSTNLLYRGSELGATNSAVPDVGESLMLRYCVWNSFAMSGRSIRELVALAYYWFEDWI